MAATVLMILFLSYVIWFLWGLAQHMMSRRDPIQARLNKLHR